MKLCKIRKTLDNIRGPIRRVRVRVRVRVVVQLLTSFETGRCDPLIAFSFPLLFDVTNYGEDIAQKDDDVPAERKGKSNRGEKKAHCVSSVRQARANNVQPAYK